MMMLRVAKKEIHSMNQRYITLVPHNENFPKLLIFKWSNFLKFLCFAQKLEVFKNWHLSLIIHPSSTGDCYGDATSS